MTADHKVFNRLRGSAGWLTLSVVVAIVIGMLVPGSWSWMLRALAGWSAGAGTFLSAAWTIMLRSDAEQTRHRCRRDDPHRGTVRALLLVASAASILAVCLALRESSGSGHPHEAFSVGVPILATTLAWLLVHTLHALHYARMYYHNDDDPDGPPSGGFDLHHAPDDQPDYRDFIYVAFAIACTFGVTDTVLTCKSARRTVTGHAVLSFAFATVVLGLAVNVITNLTSGGR